MQKLNFKEFIKKIDYRHYICLIITICFVLISAFVFPYAIPRLIETFRDFGLSIAYYFTELFGFEDVITPSVTSYSKMPFTISDRIPLTWEEFKIKWSLYWQAFADSSNFFAYLDSSKIGLKIFANIVMLIVPIFFVIYLKIDSTLNRKNIRYNEDTKPLQAFKKLSTKIYRPTKKFVKEFIAFVKNFEFRIPNIKKPKKGDIVETKGIKYWEIWAFIWLLNFNIFSIVIAGLAYYFYLVVSFDFLSLYTQVHKLLLDLSVMFKFIPLFVWIIIVFFVMYKLSIKKGYDNLDHNERKNRGFLNSVGIIKEVYGYVGAGKTALITDIALSCECKMVDDALEIMLEKSKQYPNFPWIMLELEIRRAIKYHVIYDKWSCWRWVDKKYVRWINNPTPRRIFDYDYERYGVSYDDKLSVKDIWQVILDYTCAYVIYVSQTSYIISNYSIRSDILEDYIGNFPLRNTNFFKRDSKMLDSFSRYAHIFDQDMIRLGKIMMKNNPNRYAFGWGVYVISEIDKERKNSPELLEIKKSSEECNQKNDLANVTLTLARHATIVANRVFVHIIGDLQRIGALGASTTQLGDLILVREKSERTPVLPFYSPFWFFDGIFSIIISKFDRFFLNYRYNRSDNSLIMYFAKNIVSKISQYRERIYNIFGTEVLSTEIKNGLNDNEVLKRKWYRSSKKVFSARYATDCMSAIFYERGQLNTVGLDDLATYAGIMATNDERELLNSHMQKEFNLLRANNDTEPSIETTVEEPDEMSDSVKSIFKKIEESYTPEQLEKLVAKCYEKNISKRINNIIEKTSEEINVQEEKKE